jgi:hypothetical protein
MAGRLLSLLGERPGLVVSLPANSPELAKAAAEGGADALKVHIHVHHDASGTQFGSLAEERDNLEQILALGLPTGIVPGTRESLPTPDEMQQLAAMGLDFFDMYADDMPDWLLHFGGMTRVVAVNAPEELSQLPGFEALGFDMVEAAIVPHREYGGPLTGLYQSRYQQVRKATRLPTIVPTQLALSPAEASLLVHSIGMNAIMIGAIVTGKKPDTLQRATRRFAAALAAA